MPLIMLHNGVVELQLQFLIHCNVQARDDLRILSITHLHIANVNPPKVTGMPGSYRFHKRSNARSNKCTERSTATRTNSRFVVRLDPLISRKPNERLHAQARTHAIAIREASNH